MSDTNLRDLYNILSDRESMFNWIRSQQLIQPPNCPRCGCRASYLYKTVGSPIWYCDTHWSLSVLTGTIFARSKLPVEKVLQLFYFFAKGDTSYNTLKHELRCNSNRTISRWLNICREICSRSVEATELGGVGSEVEVDESLIGSRKSGRGRVVRHTWIIGFIERNSVGNRRGGRFVIDISPNNRRDKTCHSGDDNID